MAATTSTAAGASPGPNQRGVDDATSAASGPALTTPQAPAAAPRSGPTAGQATGDAGATGYPRQADRWRRYYSATTAEGGTRGRRSEQHGNEQIATTAAPRMVRVSNATLMYPSNGSMKEALVMGRQRTLRSAPAMSRARRNMAARQPRQSKQQQPPHSCDRRRLPVTK